LEQLGNAEGDAERAQVAVVALDSDQARHDGYLGSLGIAFSVPKLLKGVLDDMPIKGVRMTLFDIGSAREDVAHKIPPVREVLFDSHGSIAQPTPALDRDST